MRDQKLKIRSFKIICIQRFHYYFRKFFNSYFKDSWSIHVWKILCIVDHCMAHEHITNFGFIKISKLVFSNPIVCMCTGVIHGKYLCIISIAMQVSTKNTAVIILCWLQNNGACAITKDHRDISSTGTKIKSERMFFTRNNKYVLVHTCSDKLVTGTKCIHETRTL